MMAGGKLEFYDVEAEELRSCALGSALGLT